MDCLELKEKILNNELTNEMLILSYQDTNFIPVLYVKTIAENKGMWIRHIDGPQDLSHSAFDEDEDNNVLSVIMLDDWKDFEPYNFLLTSTYYNVIVICKDVPEEVNSIEIPKLDEDVVRDYIVKKCIGLQKENIDVLMEIYKKDGIYKLDNILSELCALSSEVILYFDDVIRANENYGSYTVFDLVEYIFNNDTKNIAKILKIIDTLDISPFSLIANLITYTEALIRIKETSNFKNYSDIKYWLVKKINVFKDKIPLSNAMTCYLFITDFDRKVKNGEQVYNYLYKNKYVLDNDNLYEGTLTEFKETYDLSQICLFKSRKKIKFYCSLV